MRFAHDPTESKDPSTRLTHFQLCKEFARRISLSWKIFAPNPAQQLRPAAPLKPSLHPQEWLLEIPAG
jgi:hypothetical protein